MSTKTSGIKKFLGEFKEFAMRGNVLDLAIGVIIGGAFSTITTSLVNDIFMPFIGLFLGGINFSTWVIKIPAIFKTAEPATLNIGTFILAVINFIVIAFIVFLVVKGVNALRALEKKKEEEAPAPDPQPSAEEALLAEIRDLLKDKASK